MFDDEISPEELFNRFFAGGGFGGGPFGMRASFHRLGICTLTRLQKVASADRSSSLIWAEALGSQYTGWVAERHDGGHGTPNSRSKAERVPLRSYCHCSCSSFCPCCPRSSPAQDHLDPASASTIRSRP